MPRKLTTEEWIKKAKIKHGDKYDYTEVKYVNNRTKVNIKCKVDDHGTFPQIPSNHLGRGD